MLLFFWVFVFVSFPFYFPPLAKLEAKRWCFVFSVYSTANCYSHWVPNKTVFLMDLWYLFFLSNIRDICLNAFGKLSRIISTFMSAVWDTKAIQAGCKCTAWRSGEIYWGTMDLPLSWFTELRSQRRDVHWKLPEVSPHCTEFVDAWLSMRTNFCEICLACQFSLMIHSAPSWSKRDDIVK